MLDSLSKQSRRILAGLAIVSLMTVTVRAFKKTSWGSLMASHPEKQKGAKSPAVNLVEFSDFQCPSCKAASPIIKELLERYPEDLRVVFKHYPLENRHPFAKSAAIAAECAKDQKKFWPFHDLLYERQEKWSVFKDVNAAYEEFTKYGEELGLEMSAFHKCRKSSSAASAVNADVKEGDARQVDSTPTFFLNNYLLSGAGQLHREGARLIEIEIRNAKRTVKTNTSPTK